MRSGTNGLVTVERFLGGYHFAPSGDTIPLYRDQENEPRVDTPKARLEGLSQRQTDESHGHSLDRNRMIDCRMRVSIRAIQNISHGARTIAYRDSSGKKLVQHLLSY